MQKDKERYVFFFFCYWVLCPILVIRHNITLSELIRFWWIKVKGHGCGEGLKPYSFVMVGCNCILIGLLVCSHIFIHWGSVAFLLVACSWIQSAITNLPIRAQQHVCKSAKQLEHPVSICYHLINAISQKCHEGIFTNWHQHSLRLKDELIRFLWACRPSW